MTLPNRMHPSAVASTSRRLRAMAAALALLLLAPLAAEAQTPAPRADGRPRARLATLPRSRAASAAAVSHGTVRVNGRPRAYRAALPGAATMRSAHRLPLLLVFHGMGGGVGGPSGGGLDELAARGLAVVVYPEADGASWSMRDRRNADLDLFDALLPELARHLPADTSRVHVVGMSNGAYFAHLLGARRSDRVAGVVAHSGGLGVLSRRGIGARRKYPVLIVHGAEDRVVPVAEARRARDVYRQEGHVVEYLELPGLGHGWAEGGEIDARLWAFVAGRPPR